MGGAEAAASEKENRALHLVCPRLAVSFKDLAPAPSILGGRHARVDAEFLNGLCGRKENDRINQRVVIVDAIIKKVIRLGPQAVRREGGAAGIRVAEGLRVCSRTTARGFVTVCAA